LQIEQLLLYFDILDSLTRDPNLQQRLRLLEHTQYLDTTGLCE
jgi:hypothetical protein